jgi:hypothetical protein
MNSLFELNEYANSPADKAVDGTAALLLLFIFIVCAILFS